RTSAVGFAGRGQEQQRACRVSVPFATKSTKGVPEVFVRRIVRAALAAAIAAVVMLFPLDARGLAPSGTAVAAEQGLTAAQRADLRSIAGDTWRFYADDVDSATSLP